jgi:hypothetical protein
MNPRLGGPLLAPLSIAALVAAGCQGSAEEGLPPPRPTATEPAPPAPPFEGVEPTGEAIFAWLNGERYRETWELFPGTTPLHEGTEDHGALLTTYANPVAMEALERGTASMPPRAVIAVEDYLADSTLSTISVMLRVDDPDPESAGWRFTRFGPAGEVVAGVTDSCSSCHVLEPDLVFGWELGAPLPIDSTGATPGGGGAP